MRLQPGTFLQGDKYRIIDVLGQGGFGITYLAEQVMAERKVCIKEFFPKEYYKRDEDSHSISLGTQGSAAIMDLYKAKFVKEAKTIAKLDHPNIIHIFDVFTENNTAYYVMEYIEGESLSDVVKRNGSALSESVAVDYIKQAASALGYIHERKIMHLDVKPANIMLRKEDGRPILIDFGLSKQYDAEGNQTSSTPVGISAGFAPMEQYQQGGVKEFSPETDIYSLGASLYYLVTGCVPPQAAAIVDDGLPELPAHLSANVRNAIERSMEVQRKRRPHSMDEFVALLDDSKKVVPIIPAPQSESTVIAAASANIPDESTKLGEAPTPTPKAEAPKKEWTPKYSTEKPKTSEDEKSKKRWLIWLLGLLLIICGVYFIIGANSGDNSDEKRSNAPREERNDNVQREESANAELEVTATVEAAEAMAEIDNSEETRLAEEEAARQAEQQRIAEQKKKEEAARKAEQQRLAEEEAARKTNSPKWVDLGLSVKWAMWNVGANCTEEYGNYYAWGETTPKRSYTENNSTTYLNDSIEDIGGNATYDASTANWGRGWRLPTKAEFEELINNCDWTWTTRNKVKGYEARSKINGNIIFFPAAGLKGGPFSGLGSNGDYWSSTPDGVATYKFCFNDGDCYMGWDTFRCYGSSVRAVYTL